VKKGKRNWRHAPLASDCRARAGAIEALTAGLEKVSAQVEVSKPAPQMVLSNQ
jgi:hypothetical protein